MRKAESTNPAKSGPPLQGGNNQMIPENTSERIEIMVMFRIISRRSWDELQSWHRACPGSTIEHLMHGLYVLTIPPGGTGEGEAA